MDFCSSWTLYITPVVYIYMERFRTAKWFRRRKKGETIAGPQPVLQQ